MKQFLKRFTQKKNTVTQKPHEEKESVGDIIRFTLIALLIVVPIRMFIAQPFIVSGDSMFPTFHNAEYLIVDELTYRLQNPVRGDVIIFRYPNNPSRFFIKRVIGLPGETVLIKQNSVHIQNSEHPEGFVLSEDYVNVPISGNQTTTLAEDEYFVMGDNRPASSDSRAWGPLHEKYIVGRALLRVLPLQHFSLFPGHIKKFNDNTQ